MCVVDGNACRACLCTFMCAKPDKEVTTTADSCGAESVGVNTRSAEASLQTCEPANCINWQTDLISDIQQWLVSVK